MSSQVLNLFVNEFGDPSNPHNGSAMQWNGGPANLYAWPSGSMSLTAKVQISLDGGTTWFDSGTSISVSSPGEFQPGFSQPSIMVRGVMGPNYPGSSSLNLRLVGYDGT